MKQALGLELGQHLVMTPRMRQAIRMLQLSSIELRGELRQLIESNYMLEADEDLPLDEWMGQHAAGYGENGAHALPGSEESLRDRLVWQLENARFSDEDRLIAAVIIDSIDERGYLDGSMDDLLDTLARLGHRAEPEEVEAVLQRVQRFEPPGVAARDLSECLLRQIEELPADRPCRDLAARIARHHLEVLARRDFAGLRRRLRVGREEVAGALVLLRALNPRPDAGSAGSRTVYVAPDLRVLRERQDWRVELTPGAIPRLRINPLYAALAGRGGGGRDGEDPSLRQHLSEARWLVRSLESRSETLLRVGRAIVRRQSGFLERGEEGMRPLVLRDVASELDLHESTVSRVAGRKYVETPRGVFELKYFFSSQVPTVDGGAASATAIRAHLRNIIAKEDPRRPWSDRRLALGLESAGFRVARRTVSKYRESLGIPPSGERRRSDPRDLAEIGRSRNVSREFRCN